MKNPTTQQMVEALAKAAGWKLNEADPIGGVYFDSHHTVRTPDESHDDAMALQERLCVDAEFRDKYAECLTEKFWLSNPDYHDQRDSLHDLVGMASMFSASLSPADRCRALYAALPEER